MRGLQATALGTGLREEGLVSLRVFSKEPSQQVMNRPRLYTTLYLRGSRRVVVVCLTAHTNWPQILKQARSAWQAGQPR